MNKEIGNVLVNKILLLLKKVCLKDKIEILANIFLVLGFNEITDSELNLSSQFVLKASEIPTTILKHVKEHGDTLGNTLARQGLVLLSWLETGEKHE